MLSVVEEVVSAKAVNYLLLGDFLKSFRNVICESHRSIIGRDRGKEGQGTHNKSRRLLFHGSNYFVIREFEVVLNFIFATVR